MAELSVVGQSVPPVDALDKVTGKAKYSMDLKLPGMLYGKVLRSPYPHARIININTSKAEKLLGVKVVVTGKDAPKEKIGHIMDRPVLAQDVVRFVGEPVAAVAANSVEIAEEALELIEVDYEELPTLFDPEEGVKPNPPVLLHPDLFQYARSPVPWVRLDPELPGVFTHAKVRKGDVEKGFQEADLVLENRFSTARLQHCATEPHNAIAQPESDGGLTVWASTNSIHMFKRELCQLFGLPRSKVRVIALNVGGNFGGKESPGVVVPDIAALLALKARRPVKLVLSRDEVFVDATAKEAMIIYIKDGVKADGTLLARQMRVILNAGAYSCMSLIITIMCRQEAVGSYRLPNFRWDSYAVATNYCNIGPFRSVGGSEIAWAIESQMDMIAERLGIDPIELRKKNLLKEGEENACGMPTHSIGARECLDKVAEWIEWGKPPLEEKAPWKRGRGIAQSNRLTGAGGVSVAEVKVHEDAVIEVRHSAHETGQGCNTVLAQIAAEEFGTSVDKVKIVFSDTAITPYDHGTFASRTTFIVGNAVRLACQDAKRKIFDIASARLGVPAVYLDIKDGVVYAKERGQSINISQLFTPMGFLLPGGEIMGTGTYTVPFAKEDQETGQGASVASFSHGANAAEVMVNTETGEVKVLRIGGAFDMGQPINPKLCEIQIESGMAMGIGMALSEQIVFENGVAVNPGFMNYGVPYATEVPTGEDVKSMIAATPHREAPFGAKGLGECVINPVAAAITNAIYNAVGVRIKELPITKEKLLKALKKV